MTVWALYLYSKRGSFLSVSVYATQAEAEAAAVPRRAECRLEVIIRCQPLPFTVEA